jgi:[1-hydroxy-2-(trimethylamino)ethyl]phosphonate dioxygenase
MSQVVDHIFRVFAERGDDTYLGEPVSLTEHMLQSAYAAEQDGAGPELVAAAVLHDFGHMVHDLDPDSAAHGVDTVHEDVGAEFLARHFPPSVTEPIRLHVASKRYLCAVEPSYLEQLSPASLHSLELQGGPFTADQVAEFERGPYAASAVRLRRYDDVAKVAGLTTPPLEHYRQALESQLREPD